MRMTVMAIALLMSGAAFAQTTTDYDTTDMDTHADHTTSVNTTSTDTTADTSTESSTTVNTGWNGMVVTAVGGPLVDPVTGETVTGDDESYPACTATVTDNCLQTYERGRSR